MIGTAIKFIISIVFKIFRVKRTSKEVKKARQDKDFAWAIKKGNSKEVGQKWVKRRDYKL